MVGDDGGAINWASPGVSAAKLRMDRPPPDPFPPEEELPPPPAAANGEGLDRGEVGDARPPVDPNVVAGARLVAVLGASVEMPAVFLVPVAVSLEDGGMTSLWITPDVPVPGAASVLVGAAV